MNIYDKNKHVYKNNKHLTKRRERIENAVALMKRDKMGGINQPKVTHGQYGSKVNTNPNAATSKTGAFSAEEDAVAPAQLAIRKLYMSSVGI